MAWLTQLRPRSDAGETSRVAPAAPPPPDAGVRVVTAEGGRPRSRGGLRGWLSVLGPGLVTGAADDDPCAIGVYSQAGAAFGYRALWLAPITFPMMSAVVYLSAKIGMVTGTGLAGVIRLRYGRWVLYPVVVALLIANVIEAGADMGAIAAAVNLLLPVPRAALNLLVACCIIAMQFWCSYRTIERTFRWLTVALLGYVAAALLAKPDLGPTLRGTLLPHLRFDAAFLATLVAVIGTTLSPYLYFWQASQQVEEEVAMGRRRRWQRRGATDRELRYAARDINVGMFFSNVIMYFIILAAAATLFRAGRHDVASAAEAAAALRPVAGWAATLLFVVGVVGVGFLAVPVLTAGAAYALAETFGWRHGLDEQPRRARQFYAIIAVATLLAMGMNFVHINAMAALFWSSVIMGFLAPPLMVILMLITNSRRLMGDRTNGFWLNVLGWGTTAAVSAAAVGLVVLWVRR